MNSAKQYVITCGELMGKTSPHAKAYYDRYLKFGREYHLSPLSAQQWEFFKSLRGNLKMKIKQCYKNCQRIALADETGRVKYVEGVATGVIPVPHAWITIDGKVFDPTWDKLKEKQPQPEYFGIEISKEMICRNQVKTGAYCSVLDHMLECLVAPPDGNGRTSVEVVSTDHQGLNAGDSSGSVDPLP